MKSKRSYIVIFLMTMMFLSGCLKEEIKPSLLDTNLFEVLEDDQSAEAKLRRTFFNETGAYLLFSDTLKRGDEQKVIKVNYSVTKEGREFYDSNLFKYVYLETDQDKSNAVAFIKDKIMPYASKKELPYSILLVDKIIYYKYDRKTKDYDLTKGYDNKTIEMGLQMSVIAKMKDILESPANEQSKIQKDIMSTMIKKSLYNMKESAYAKFYSYSLPYYDKTYDEESSDMPDIKDIKELGFIKAWSFKPGKRISFYDQSKDKNIFIQELLSTPEKEWREKYQEYDLVIKKLEALKSMLEDGLGYSLDYLNE